MMVKIFFVLLVIHLTQLHAFSGHVCGFEKGVICYCTKMSTDKISLECTATQPTVELPKFKVEIYVNTVFMILHGKFGGVDIDKLLKTWYSLEFLNLKETDMICTDKQISFKRTDILCFQEEKPNTTPTVVTIYDQTTNEYNSTTHYLAPGKPINQESYRTGLLVCGILAGILFIVLLIICVSVLTMYIKKRRRDNAYASYASRGPIYGGLAINMGGFDENEAEL
jgi:hypothetical protein